MPDDNTSNVGTLIKTFHYVHTNKEISLQLGGFPPAPFDPHHRHQTATARDLTAATGRRLSSTLFMPLRVGGNQFRGHSHPYSILRYPPIKTNKLPVKPYPYRVVWLHGLIVRAAARAILCFTPKATSSPSAPSKHGFSHTPP